MKISELAKQANCDVETVRYYEKVGMLAEPPRTESGYRVYTDEHVQSLRFIRQCRTLRMGLSEIRALLAMKNDRLAGCQTVNEILDQHVRAVDQQLRDLQNLRVQLIQLREQCVRPHVIEDCGILQELSIRSNTT